MKRPDIRWRGTTDRLYGHAVIQEARRRRTDLRRAQADEALRAGLQLRVPVAV